MPKKPTVGSDATLPMTAEQSALLKILARDAYEPEAFSAQLMRGEARRRIDSLNAKLKLQDGPPHTL